MYHKLMNRIELKCSGCDNNFLILKKEYNRQIRNGRSKFYCDWRCSGMFARLDDLTPFRHVLRAVERTSKYREKKCNLTLEYLKELWEKQKGICPYSGCKMFLHLREEKHFPYSSSLDRIDPSKGYEKGNVEFVCLFVNYGKNGFSKESVIDFLGHWQRSNAPHLQ